jgi:hypothetical protein
MKKSIEILALALLLGFASVDTTNSIGVVTAERSAEPTGIGTILPPPVL